MYILKKYSISKDTVIMIGDRTLDIQAAKNAEVKSMLFDADSNNVVKEFDFVAKSMVEIINILF